MVGVDVLDVEDALLDPCPGLHVERLMGEALGLGRRLVKGGAIRAQQGVPVEDRLEDGRHAGPAQVLEHGVGCRAMAVTDDDHGDLLRRQAALLRLAATVARLAAGRRLGRLALGRSRPGLGALVALQKEGFVGFDNARERFVLLVTRRLQPAVSPAEGRGVVDAAFRGGFADAQPIPQRLAVGRPCLPMAQSGQRRAGQRVEGLATALAAEPLNAQALSPLLESGGAAVRAVGMVGHPDVDGGDRLGQRRGLSQRFNHCPALAGRQIAQSRHHRREINLSHRATLPPLHMGWRWAPTITADRAFLYTFNISLTYLFRAR